MAAVLVTLVVSLLELLVGSVVSLLELSVVAVVGLVVSLLELVVFLPAFFASFKKFSFTFFHNIFPALRLASTHFGSLSFLTFCDVLSMFILRYKEKELK